MGKDKEELMLHEALIQLYHAKDAVPKETGAQQQNIADWIGWLSEFLLWFSQNFMHKGKYQKPKVWHWPRVIGGMFILGLKLLTLFKNK